MEQGVEQAVRQPPALSVPLTKRQKAGARMDKRRAAFVKGWMARRRKAHKANMASQNKGIKKANAGARMNRRRAAFSNQQARGVRAGGREAQRAHNLGGRYVKGHLSSVRAATRTNRSAIRASNQGIRAHKAAIKLHMKKQRAASPRARARQMARAHNTAMKFGNLLYLARLAKKLFKQKKIDGRNHGAAGVNSGKFLTGRAGRK